MDKIRPAIGAAVACGMLIGGYIANGIGDGHFWLGTFGGGFIAYALVDPVHFWAGVVSAAKATHNDYRKMRAWQPYTTYWRRWRANAFQFWGTALDLIPGCLTLYVSTAWIIDLISGSSLESNLMSPSFWAWGLGLSVFCALFATGSVNDEASTDTQKKPAAQRRYRDQLYRKTSRVGVMMVLLLNPITIGFTATIYGAKLLCIIVETLREPISRKVHEISYVCSVFASLFGSFFGYLFAYVHTNVRTVCFVDAAVGVMLVHNFGGSLTANIVGAAIGAVFALVQYWAWCKFEPWFLQRFNTLAEQRV